MCLLCLYLDLQSFTYSFNIHCTRMYLALLLHVLIQRFFSPLVNRRWWAEARALLPQQGELGGATNRVGPVSTWSWSGVKWRGSEKHIRTHKCIFFINVIINYDGQTPYSVQFSEIMKLRVCLMGPPLFVRAPPQPGPRTFGSCRPTWTAPAWQSSRGERPGIFGCRKCDRIPPKNVQRNMFVFMFLHNLVIYSYMAVCQNLVPLLFTSK